MKVLLDENLSKKLKNRLTGCEVRHVREIGWAGTKNGALMNLIEENEIIGFITADKNLTFQNRIEGRPFFVIVLDFHPMLVADQLNSAEVILGLIRTAMPGHTYRITC